MNDEKTRLAGNAKLANGKKLMVYGFVLFMIMALVINSDQLIEYRAEAFGGLFVSIVLILVGRFHNYRGRQMLASLKTETVFNDENPDILYLRSFNKDSSMPNYLGRIFDGDITGMLSNVYTEEEQLAEVLEPIGDMVAIGKPGEKLPTPGAARVYVGDHEWQDVVIRQMKNAKLVIIKIGGDGEGLNWEIEYSDKNVPHRQLLFYVNMKNRAYKKYRQSVGNKLNFWFPENPNPNNPYKPMNGFFRYDKKDQLEFLPLKSHYMRTSEFYGRAKLTPIKYALKPVFEELGVNWEPPPFSKVSLVIAAIGVLIALALLGY